MKKILLLATGGTIASVEGEKGLTPGITPNEIISYLPEENRNYQIDTEVVMNIDSTNMQPEYWGKIAEVIYKKYDQYDSFVITHGTDTMAYTSAALSYMLQNVDKPVIVTGSQLPINYHKTDARKNIVDAVRFACENVGGIFIVFDGRVIIGTRAIKMRTKSYDAFESINSPYIAYVEGEKVNYHVKLSNDKKGELLLDTALCPDVFLLKLYPGTKPELFDTLKTLYKGIVIETFGSGGIPFQGRDLSPKVQELIDADVAVVITTQCLEEGANLSVYEVGQKIDQSKVILSRDMNTEALLPKLMWTLGKTEDLAEVKKIMETSIAGDRTPDDDLFDEVL
ncbi:asparaginase [Bacillus taeanensis]|uniref:asparaginase n=1 Tax=Bacillus taeanensis TaxID=273032 RepID=A0A366XV48_9BACI|nr:asparaginase [Bacillus taeanensis]RBW69015.1 L-asparaginase 1 [Bacillus taeanensis]